MGALEAVALLGLAAVWGASFLFIRIAVPELGPFPLMAGRVVLAAAALGILIRIRGGRVPLRPYTGRLVLLGLVHAALPFALIAAAEIHLTASMAAVLLATQPLFVTGVTAWTVPERPTPWTLAGLLLGVAGVAVLVGWSPAGLSRAALLSSAAVLLAALCYAAGSVYARHRMADAPVMTLALGQQLGAALWLVVPAVLTAPTRMPGAGAWWALVALALLSTALAYLVFFWLLERIGTVKTSTVTYAIPVFGVLWGALFLHEPLAPGLLAGLACVLVSLGLVNRR